MPFRRLRFTVLFLASLVIGLWHQPGFRSTLAGVLAYFLAFGIWLAVVAPVNRTVAARAPERGPETRPSRASWPAYRSAQLPSGPDGRVCRGSHAACNT
jgi:hypothetical protein